jgi:hypothetical protein
LLRRFDVVELCAVDDFFGDSSEPGLVPTDFDPSADDLPALVEPALSDGDSKAAIFAAVGPSLVCVFGFRVDAGGPAAMRAGSELGAAANGVDGVADRKTMASTATNSPTHTPTPVKIVGIAQATRASRGVVDDL